MFCVCGVYAAGSVHDNHEKCVPHPAEVMRVYPDTYGRPDVSVMLNGTREKFLVDTAGIFSAVQPETVSALHLKTRSSDIPVTYLVNHSSPDRKAYIRKLQIGALALPSVWFVVMPQGDYAAGSQGMISGDILHKYDVELDPVARRISLYAHSSCGGENVSWTDQPYVVLPFEMDKSRDDSSFHTVQNGPEWHISVPAKLNGKDIRMVIDTGAAVSVMQYGDASRVLTKDQLQNIREVSAPGAPQKLGAYNFDTLRFGGIVVKGQDIAIVPGKRSAWAHLLNLKPQLILGADVLRKLHTYIAYDEKKLYITAANAH